MKMETMKQKKSPQKLAIETVLEHLRSKGEEPKDISKRGPGDIHYDNITCEVKGRVIKWEEEKPPFITLASPELTDLFEDHPNRFEVWFVRNVGEEKSKRQIIKVRGEVLKGWGEKPKTKGGKIISNKRGETIKNKQYCAQITLGEEFWKDKKHFERLR
jgi:hypothetical protein